MLIKPVGTWASIWAIAALIGCSIPGVLFSATPEGGSAPQELAEKILTGSGVQGGLVVHLGCRDGRLTAALRATDAYTVQGLETDPAQLAAARRYVVERDLYGPVSIEQLSGTRLPYADNLINLVVVERPGAVPQAEIARVLAPHGVAYTRNGDRWDKFVKPRPADIDDWSHFLHDAGNNAVAHDAQVGPPRSIQWVAPPLWLRSHETPSGVEGLVSAGGRLFYFFDEGPMGITDQRLPERWSLICRDAFNGKLLWKRPLDQWGWPQWAEAKFADQDWTKIRGGRTVVPQENQRRIVATADRLYATLGFRAPLSILDPATGQVMATVKDTAPAKELLVSDGIVVVHCQDPTAPASRRRGQQQEGTASLVAVRGATGEVLWRKPAGGIRNLLFAIDAGRVFFRSGQLLTCLNLDSGELLWEADPPKSKGKTLIAHDGVVLLYAAKTLAAWDGGTGQALWRHTDVPSSSGNESPDLFVANGVVWRGMIAIDKDQQPVGKSADAMAIGFDLRSGAEVRRVVVRRLRSPEHHHRCYRNKATDRYIISGMEGAEFMDLEGDNSCQNNWLRGACKLGIMPCNGLLYAPPDQCFCQPGSKLLGFIAVAADAPTRDAPVADDQRLVKGPAFGAVAATATAAGMEQWPTYRHDAARHGCTPATVAAEVEASWRVKLGGRLTAPVAVDGRVYVAACDAHTVHAVAMDTGKPLWKFIAGARIDSPPTIYKGMVLFGSCDGYVYCLRATDGELAWRFLAAPLDCRIGCFDQLESVWPVHGSVLVRAGIAYVTAGRSTYLDGGIRLYGLDPRSGRIVHQTILSGPLPDIKSDRDVAFYLTGANSDVLVSEGDSIYMRQKRLTLELDEVPVPVLSSKGAQDVGLHVFSTASLLDSSWYNRTFWMYSKRWPGFQLANQAPKSGQLLVVGAEKTFAVRVFYRRNVHSPMFFPGKEGYLLFADLNGNEPQIVGEPGAKEPVAWLPQSRIPRSGDWGLDSKAFGLDKMIGYTRSEPSLWQKWLPIRIRAMVKAGPVLFVAGPPDRLDPKDPMAALEGRDGARLAAVSTADGTELASCPLDVPPVFDGLIATDGHLFVSLEDGSLACLRESR